jgi:hypothetical protein
MVSRAASGGCLALQPQRATCSQPESLSQKKKSKQKIKNPANNGKKQITYKKNPYEIFFVLSFLLTKPHIRVLFLLCWREDAFSNYQIVHGLPPPPFFHPDSLEYWCLTCGVFTSVGT